MQHKNLHTYKPKHKQKSYREVHRCKCISMSCISSCHHLSFQCRGTGQGPVTDLSQSHSKHQVLRCSSKTGAVCSCLSCSAGIHRGRRDTAGFTVGIFGGILLSAPDSAVIYAPRCMEHLLLHPSQTSQLHVPLSICEILSLVAMLHKCAYMQDIFCVWGGTHVYSVCMCHGACVHVNGQPRVLVCTLFKAGSPYCSLLSIPGWLGLEHWEISLSLPPILP